MECPSCSAETRVLESRRAEGGAAVRRRRRCPRCERRFTTFERRERAPAWVIKRNGERQPFNAEKLRGALASATHKREEHVLPADLDELVERIEFEAEQAGGELSSDAVRQMCLDGLSRIDTGAFLQFAGVETSDMDSFRDELARLDARKDRGFSPLATVGSVRGEEDPKRPTQREQSRGER